MYIYIYICIYMYRYCVSRRAIIFVSQMQVSKQKAHHNVNVISKRRNISLQYHPKNEIPTILKYCMLDSKKLEHQNFLTSSGDSGVPKIMNLNEFDTPKSPTDPAFRFLEPVCPASAALAPVKQFNICVLSICRIYSYLIYLFIVKLVLINPSLLINPSPKNPKLFFILFDFVSIIFKCVSIFCLLGSTAQNVWKIQNFRLKKNAFSLLLSC